jgi:hypothetical protein
VRADLATKAGRGLGGRIAWCHDADASNWRNALGRAEMPAGRIRLARHDRRARPVSRYLQLTHPLRLGHRWGQELVTVDWLA